MYTWSWSLFRGERCLVTCEELVDFGTTFLFHLEIIIKIKMYMVTYCDIECIPCRLKVWRIHVKM